MDDVTTIAVPKGWQLVPIEPTSEMVRLGFNAHGDSYEEGNICDHPRCVYQAMLSAAPSYHKSREQGEAE